MVDIPNDAEISQMGHPSNASQTVVKHIVKWAVIGEILVVILGPYRYSGLAKNICSLVQLARNYETYSLWSDMTVN